MLSIPDAYLEKPYQTCKMEIFQKMNSHASFLMFDKVLNIPLHSQDFWGTAKWHERDLDPSFHITKTEATYLFNIKNMDI